MTDEGLTSHVQSSLFIFPKNVPLSKRICRFENVLSDYYHYREKKNCLIGKWLTSKRRLLGAPSLSTETVAIVRKYFNVTANESNLYSVETLFSEDNSLFNTTCRIISCRISEWIQNSVKRFLSFIFVFF